MASGSGGVNENRAGMISQSFSNLDNISLSSHLDLFGRVLSQRRVLVSFGCPVMAFWRFMRSWSS